MAKLNFKELTKLKNLMNDFIDFLNRLKNKEKQEEALLVIRKSLK